jgi:hypothetical protein
MNHTDGKFSNQREHHIRNHAPSPTGPRDFSQDAWERERVNGGRKRDLRNIAIEFSTHDLYHLLKFLEERAVHSTSYVEVRQAVLFSEMIREQARAQGF